MAKFSFKGVWSVLKASFKGFSEDKVPKLSGSLAYYTVFSLAPMFVIIIFVAGLVLGQEAAQGQIEAQLTSFIGIDAASQIQDMIHNAAITDKGGMALVIGIIVLLIGATTVFGEIQDSINQIWGLKTNPKKGLLALVMSRLLSFGMIATLGFLLLVSLMATAVVESLMGRLIAVFPDGAVVLIYIANLVLTLAVVAALFAIIFKVLPDAKITWKAVWPGALATALLFMIGKFLISFYIAKSEIGSTYGAAGSLAILLVWIYYSAMILYFGAEFTKAWAVQHHADIRPSKFAVWDKKVSVGGADEGSKATLGEEVHKQEVQATLGEEAQKLETKKEERTVFQPAQPVKIPAYVPTKKAESEIQEEMKASGMLTTLGGLLLYMFNSSKKKDKDLKPLGNA
ncbi:MAG TPA: YihY/virulence factor BrkB family protein [Chitinophagaceae bacterium]